MRTRFLVISFIVQIALGSFDVLEPNNFGSYYSPIYTFLGKQTPFLFVNTSVTSADPFNACTDLKNAASLNNTLVVIDNGILIRMKNKIDTRRLRPNRKSKEDTTGWSFSRSHSVPKLYRRPKRCQVWRRTECHYSCSRSLTWQSIQQTSHTTQKIRTNESLSIARRKYSCNRRSLDYFHCTLWLLGFRMYSSRCSQTRQVYSSQRALLFSTSYGLSPRNHCEYMYVFCIWFLTNSH